MRTTRDYDYTEIQKRRIDGKIGITIKPIEKYWLVGENIFFQVSIYNKTAQDLWVPAERTMTSNGDVIRFPIVRYEIINSRTNMPMTGSMNYIYDYTGRDSILIKAHDTVTMTCSAYMHAQSTYGPPKWAPGPAYIRAAGVGNGQSDTFYLAAKNVVKYVMAHKKETYIYLWLNKLVDKYGLFLAFSDTSINYYDYNKDTVNQTGDVFCRVTISDHKLEPVYVYYHYAGRDTGFTYIVWNDEKKNETIIRKSLNKPYYQMTNKDIKLPVLLTKENKIEIEFDKKSKKAVLTYQPMKSFWYFGKTPGRQRIEIE